MPPTPPALAPIAEPQGANLPSIRESGFTVDHKRVFLNVLRESHGNLVEAGMRAGVSYFTIDAHLRADPWFASSVAAVHREMANGPIYSSLYRRAIDARSPAGVTAAIWMQKNLDPERWNPDRVDHRRRAPTIAFKQNQFNTIVHAPHITSAAGLPPKACKDKAMLRPCGCNKRGCHKLTCPLPNVKKGNFTQSGCVKNGSRVLKELVRREGWGLVEGEGESTFPEPSHTESTQKGG